MELTTIILLDGDKLSVPPCGQHIKATSLYLIITCPELNDGAGRITVYLRKFKNTVDTVNLRTVQVFEGTRNHQALGKADSLQDSI